MKAARSGVRMKRKVVTGMSRMTGVTRRILQPSKSRLHPFSLRYGRNLASGQGMWALRSIAAE